MGAGASLFKRKPKGGTSEVADEFKPGNLPEKEKVTDVDNGKQVIIVQCLGSLTILVYSIYSQFIGGSKRHLKLGNIKLSPYSVRKYCSSAWTCTLGSTAET